MRFDRGLFLLAVLCTEPVHARVTRDKRSDAALDVDSQDMARIRNRDDGHATTSSTTSQKPDTTGPMVPGFTTHTTGHTMLTEAPMSTGTMNAISVFTSSMPTPARSSLDSEASSMVSQFMSSMAAHTRSTTTTPPKSSTSQGSHSTAAGAAHQAPTSSTPHPTHTAAPSAAHSMTSKAIAGVVCGVAAASVLGLVAVFYIWRRKKLGNPVFGIRGSRVSNNSGNIYPQSAWLYDPSITPASLSRTATSEMEQPFLPGPLPPNPSLSADIQGDLIEAPAPSLQSKRAVGPPMPYEMSGAAGHAPGSGGPQWSLFPNQVQRPQWSPYSGQGQFPPSGPYAAHGRHPPGWF